MEFRFSEDKINDNGTLDENPAKESNLYETNGAVVIKDNLGKYYTVSVESKLLENKLVKSKLDNFTYEGLKKNCFGLFLIFVQIFHHVK